MTDLGLSEFLTFKGHLSLCDSSYALDFRARIGAAGEVEVDLSHLPLTHETKFILQDRKSAEKFLEFSLTGIADDGTQFATDDLYFTSIRRNCSRKEGRTLVLLSRCAKGRFKRRLDARSETPQLQLQLKGFRNFRELVSKTKLGTIAMAGPISPPDLGQMTGYLALRADEAPADLAVWRTQANDLLEHVRMVMSFASASVLRAPVAEYYSGEELEVECRSQTEQAGTALRVVRDLNQEPVFEAAVASFFTPPIVIKNLFFAIEWFAMEASHVEGRLVNAMTALENMVDSNLGESDTLIQPKKEFEKTRRVLRKVIRDCLAKWPPGAADDAAQELNEKLGELNRRSLLRKIELLAKHWQVPLEGTSEENIRAAKQARDRVVHRGHYYGDAKVEDPVLWAHVTVIREVVTRFLLTAIGYRGRYLSYVGGCHDATFPPTAPP